MNQLSGKLIVNITNDVKTEQNIIAGTKIKYCDSEHIEIGGTYFDNTIQWLAIIANISQEKEVNAIYYIFVTLSTEKINKDVLGVVKRILSKSNVSLIVMAICGDTALFCEKQADLIQESNACFYFNSDMKFSKIK